MARDFISRFRRVVLTLCFFTLCISPSFLIASDIYILSYKSQVKNNQLIHQSLFASKAMTKVDKKFSQSATIFLDKTCTKEQFFHCYEDEILAILLKTDVSIQSTAKTKFLVAQSFSELQIAPQYVQVEFNDTFVKMSIVK